MTVSDTNDYINADSLYEMSDDELVIFISEKGFISVEVPFDWTPGKSIFGTKDYYGSGRAYSEQHKTLIYRLNWLVESGVLKSAYWYTWDHKMMTYQLMAVVDG